MEIKDAFKNQYLTEIKIYHTYIINIFTFYCYHLNLTNLLKLKKLNADEFIFFKTVNLLLKDRIALDIWKIVIDNNKSANTFNHIKNNLKRKYLINPRDVNFEKLKIEKNIETKIKNIRNHYLAHADNNLNDDSLDMSKLEIIIKDMMITFNHLLFDEAKKNSIDVNQLFANVCISANGLTFIFNKFSGAN